MHKCCIYKFVLYKKFIPFRWSRLDLSPFNASHTNLGLAHCNQWFACLCRHITIKLKALWYQSLWWLHKMLISSYSRGSCHYNVHLNMHVFNADLLICLLYPGHLADNVSLSISYLHIASFQTTQKTCNNRTTSTNFVITYLFDPQHT